MPERTDHTVDAGKLRFHTHYRSAGGDYGPAVEVFAETGPGAWTEVVRYDCFAHEPHRHHFRADGGEDRAGYTGASPEASPQPKLNWPTSPVSWNVSATPT